MKQSVFRTADLLLPRNIQMQKWSVVACDQYTSEPDYWERVAQFTGDAPSTYHMVLPEIYLEQPDVESRIKSINETMDQYIAQKTLQVFDDRMLYLERTLADGRIRRGLVGMIDLERYDYNKGAQSPIRATEGTVLERIPPRVRVREHATVELPHVMLLIDDRDQSVIEPLAVQKDMMQKVYEFTLMEQGGAIAGYLLDRKLVDYVDEALAALGNQDNFEKKYHVKGKGVLQFAVGDGNHSLATAKECYERLKKQLPPEQSCCHPARYALVELVNLHDPALSFEPIHRVVFEVNAIDLLRSLASHYELSYQQVEGAQSFVYIHEKMCERVWIKNPSSNLAVGTLQTFLDAYLAQNGGRIDYIHGDDVVEKLGKQPGNIGFLLPAMEKNQLFETVILDGVLPRKTFSMGHANDKRFYLECRKIK